MDSVLVVGGGPIGAFSAYHLKKKGKDVTWLTGGADTMSAAWASAGLVGVGLSTPLPQYEGLSSNIRWLFKKESPVKLGLGFMLNNLGWFAKYSRNRQTVVSEVGIKTQTNLSLRSLAILRELVDSGDLSVDFSKNGILQMFTSQSVRDGHVKQLSRIVGGVVDFESVDSETCMEMEPLLKKEGVVGIYFPDEGSINPQKFLGSLKHLNKSMGVNVIEKPVNSIQFDGKVISGMTTEDEEKLTYASYLMAAGANNPVVVKNLKLKVPVISAWGHSVLMIPKGKNLKRPVEIEEKGIFISNNSNLVKLTSFFEFRGLKYKPPFARFDYIEHAAAEFFPFISELSVDQKSSGMRPCVPDSLPVIGRSSRFSNLYWATGNCRQGVMQSAESGRVAAMLITGEVIPDEYNILSPSRFAI